MKSLPEHARIFLQYFERRFWTNHQGASGPNSDFERTSDLRSQLASLIHELGIGTVVDAGCGDSNLWRGLELPGIQYLGLDCVPALIEINRRVYAGDVSKSFEVADVVSCELPAADLVVCRDVVHYLPNALVSQLLANIKASRSVFLLITHNLYAPVTANTDTQVGVFRPVNLTQPPFNWPDPMRVLADTDIDKTLALWRL